MLRLTRFVRPATACLSRSTARQANHDLTRVAFQSAVSSRLSLAFSRTYASVDDADSHDDFKTIRKQYEQKQQSSAAGGSPGSAEVQQRIRKEIESHPVVVFMKGTPDAPQCGFSNLVCRILEEEGVRDFHAVNVLADNTVREGIKLFTSWPTIPQVFIKGEFIGGSDIVKSLFQSGELTTLLKNAAASSGGSSSPAAAASNSK